MGGGSSPWDGSARRPRRVACGRRWLGSVCRRRRSDEALQRGACTDRKRHARVAGDGARDALGPAIDSAACWPARSARPAVSHTGRFDRPRSACRRGATGHAVTSTTSPNRTTGRSFSACRRIRVCQRLATRMARSSSSTAEAASRPGISICRGPRGRRWDPACTEVDVRATAVGARVAWRGHQRRRLR